MSLISRSYRSDQSWAPSAASNQLAGNAEAGFRAAYAPFKHMRDAQRTRNSANVRLFAAECEGRGAGDDFQTRNFCQQDDDLFRQAVGEILLVFVRAHVGEWQHGDGGRFGIGDAGGSAGGAGGGGWRLRGGDVEAGFAKAVDEPFAEFRVPDFCYLPGHQGGEFGAKLQQVACRFRCPSAWPSVRKRVRRGSPFEKTR